MKKLVLLLLVCLLSATSFGTTVAYWNFEDGTDEVPFSAGPMGGTVDVINGYVMYGYDTTWGPSWEVDRNPQKSYHGQFEDNLQDGYTFDSTINSWSPSTWTIECWVYLEEISGWETIIGRDGSSKGGADSDFYLQNNGVDDKFRINVATVGGTRWILDGDYTVQTNTWYALAAMSDGVTLSLWLDDGTGYAQIGSLDISAQSVANNALDANTYNWTFGRGWYNGAFVDQIDGYIDNVRFSDEALTLVQDLIALPEPATIALLGLGGLLLRRKR